MFAFCSPQDFLGGGRISNIKSRLHFRAMRTQVKKLNSLPLREAAFIEVMECLAVPKIPDGPDWIYEVKLDGYRAVAVKADGALNLYSRRRNSFNRQYPLVYEVLGDLPENTVVDGEIVALDDEGKPNFSLLQHYASQASHIHYFIFDLLVYQNHDLTRLPLIERREIMGTALHFRSPRIRIAESFDTSVEEMLQAVRELGLEGVVAKKEAELLRTREARRIVDQIPAESRTGIRDRRIHPRTPRHRLAGCGLLPKQRVDLCRPYPERLRAGDEAAGVRGASPARGATVPVCQSP